DRPDEEEGKKAGGEEEHHPRERLRHGWEVCGPGERRRKGETVDRGRPARIRTISGRDTRGPRCCLFQVHQARHFAGSTRIFPAATMLKARERPGIFRSMTRP